MLLRKGGNPGNLSNAKLLKTHRGFSAKQLPVICLRCFWLFWSLGAVVHCRNVQVKNAFPSSHIPLKNAKWTPCQVNTPSIRIEILSTWRFTKKSTVAPLWGQTASQLWLAPAPPCAEPPRPLRPPAEEHELISHVSKVYSRILKDFSNKCGLNNWVLHYTKMK